MRRVDNYEPTERYRHAGEFKVRSLNRCVSLENSSNQTRGL